MVLKKYLVLLLFVLSVIYGVFISINKYYYSPFQFVYWIFCGLLLLVFLMSGIYKSEIHNKQYFPFVFIGLTYCAGWLIIPHFLRFGVFPFAILCFLYSGILLYNNRSLQTKILFIATFAFSSLNILSVLFFFSERSLITRPLINALFISNTEESKEYLLGKFSLVHFVFIGLFISVAMIIFTAGSKTKAAVKRNIYLYLLFFLSFGLSSFSGPFGAISSEYVIYLKQKAELKRMVEERKNGDYLKTFSVTTSDSSAKKVMIIIGESLNRRFMSLYGYPKNTTPNLVRLASDSSNGKLYYFTNIISPEATTVPALRKILTSINNENNLPFDKCITIVDLFKKAGYESFWVSNQEPMGKYDTPNAIIASSADHTYFTAYKNDIKNTNASTGNYFDSELFNVFNGFEEKADNKKQVFFIHLMGSHFYYKDRYPASFDVFHSKKDMDTSSYLNTVYYNDYIVSHFMQLAQKDNFDVVCYFSDHGEDMKYQHNQENYTREMSGVPFLVFLSNSYRAKHPVLNNDMDKNKNVKGMTDNFLQDIQLICGFKSSMLNPAEAFVSGKYIFKKRRVVNNSIPYDK